MAKRKTTFALLTISFGALAALPLGAVTITTTNWGTITGPATTSGTLANQGTALEVSFSLGSASQLTIFTNSYGGGMNVDGTHASAGGFMPSLVLYDGSGTFVANETFPSPIGNIDPKTGLNGDAYVKTGTLAAGSYIIALSDFLVQQSPTATNLSDGFINYGSGTTFTDVQGNVRTGAYSLNIAGAGGPVATPEPATFFLLLPAFAAAALCGRRQKREQRGK